MKYFFLQVIFILLLVSSGYAQTISIKGKVIDSKTKKHLSAVTVGVGPLSTSTNNNGEFLLNAPLNLLISKGINFSSVGYLKQHLIYKPDHYYEVGLTEKITTLNEVIIGEGENIVRRAYKNIPNNYATHPIEITGIFRTQFTRNKSYFFKSDAVLKAYIPSYSGNGNTTVKLIENKKDSIIDESLSYLRKVDDYNIVDYADFAHHSTLVKQLAKIKRYDFYIAGKQQYDNHNVYVINVTLKDTTKKVNQVEVILYIDTISYAFVAVNVTHYNVEKIGFVKIAKSTYHTTYKQIGNKWYLNEIHSEFHNIYGKENPTTNIDFITQHIDSVKVEPIDYKDKIQYFDDVMKISKKVETAHSAQFDSLFKKAEAENLIIKIPDDVVDTIKQNNKTDNQKFQTKKTSRRFAIGVLNYIRKGNIQVFYGIEKLPVKLNTTDLNPLTFSNYGFYYPIFFRLYSNAFLEIHTNGNFKNSTGTEISQDGVALAYKWIFNKNYHPIMLMPYAGIDRMLFTAKDKHNQIKYGNFEFGLHTSYELTHMFSWFISFGYNTASSNHLLENVIISPLNYNVASGFILKL